MSAQPYNKVCAVKCGYDSRIILFRVLSPRRQKSVLCGRAIKQLKIISIPALFRILTPLDSRWAVARFFCLHRLKKKGKGHEVAMFRYPPWGWEFIIFACHPCPHLNNRFGAAVSPVIKRAVINENTVWLWHCLFRELYVYVDMISSPLFSVGKGRG